MEAQADSLLSPITTAADRSDSTTMPPLWDHPLARSCAGKRMRTRIKKATRRGDAIAGNIKLFAGAAVGRIPN